MFVQVIQGKVTDPDAVKQAMDAWERDLKPGSIGFLGSTSGISPDGELFVAARFSSEKDARANSDRPEQGQWWASIEKGLSDVLFHDCTEIDEFMSGGSDDAGFVQVIQGKVTDVERARELDRKMAGDLPSSRPDILGGYTAWHPQNGRYTQVVYFTSEAEARKNEKAMADDPQMQAYFEEYQRITDGESHYIDLPTPRLT
ncbi:MAG: hypothetical protein ACLGHL_08710 [Actinomycetota bacterium]